MKIDFQRHLLVLTLALVSVVSTQTSLAAALVEKNPHNNEDVDMFGAGSSESCAAWLSSPSKESEGFTWIVGFWSGLNFSAVLTNGNTAVGHSTDGWGVVALIKRRCQDNPSESLISQTMYVYNTLKREGR